MSAWSYRRSGHPGSPILATALGLWLFVGVGDAAEGAGDPGRRTPHARLLSTYIRAIGSTIYVPQKLSRERNQCLSSRERSTSSRAVAAVSARPQRHAFSTRAHAWSFRAAVGRCSRRP